MFKKKSLPCKGGKGLPVRSMLGAVAGGLMLLSSFSDAGFSVSGTQLLDANGQAFVMRGVNHPHAWYTSNTDSIADIAATGANTVRVVLSDGQQWTRNSAADVANIISLCKQNELICVLEVHDVTGSGEAGAAGTLANAAQYWVDIASVLEGEEDYVIINIANEPFGNNVPASRWIEGHKSAIQTLRAAGLTHTLMVDAANWGQDWEQIMLNNASEVAAADSLNNTMFSVHMYQVYGSLSTVENYVSTFLNSHNLPLIVGEFGADHQGEHVDEDAILSVAEQYDIGYLGWSWSGNGGCCVSLDITNNFNANSLTPWGDRLINGVNGIAATSVRASVYGGSSSSSSSTSGSTTSSSTSSTGSSTTSSTTSSSSTGSSTSSTSSTGSSTTSSSGSSGGALQCNWYGSTYPVCENQSTGWGWENQQSCIGQTTCESQSGDGGVIGGSSSGSSTGTSSSGGSSTSTSSSSSSSTSGSSSSTTSSSSSGGETGARCEHVITNSWGGGFQGAVRITNNSTATISGWQVSWTYTDGSSVNSIWNANQIGSNPYTVENLSWNSTINPGQSVEFGFTANGSGAASAVTGAVCQ